MMDIEKRCTCCGLMLPLSEFYRARNGKFGRKAACKECDNLYERAARNAGNQTAVVNGFTRCGYGWGCR